MSNIGGRIVVGRLLALWCSLGAGVNVLNMRMAESPAEMTFWIVLECSLLGMLVVLFRNDCRLYALLDSRND